MLPGLLARDLVPVVVDRMIDALAGATRAEDWFSVFSEIHEDIIDFLSLLDLSTAHKALVVLKCNE